MTIDPATFLAIAAMALATALTRLSGLFLNRIFVLGPRQKTLLEAIPPAVLMAVIAPTALATGWAETIASAVTAFAAFRLPMLASVALGVAVAGLARAAGL